MKKKYLIIGAFVAATILFMIPNGAITFAAVSDDEYLLRQTSLALIDAQSAWDIVAKSPFNITPDSPWNMTGIAYKVKVGVIDSGIANHVDFGDNLSPGHDFFTNHSVTTDDYANHGTKVAGIIGAKGNNSIGVSGICWNVSLIPLQTSCLAEPYYLEDANATIAAINYAKNNNIPIINFSGGFYEETYQYFDSETMASITPSQQNSLKAAIKSYPGLIICAAGNNGEDLSDVKIYPGEFINEDSSVTNIIVVGGSNPNGSRNVNSNTGNLVDIYAPWSSYTTSNKSSYISFSGTSAAAPHVTGVAALIKSINYDITTAELKSALLNNYSYGKNPNGTVNPYSEKIVDAHKAVSSVAFNTEELTDGTLKITGVNFVPGDSLKIPSHINGKAVTQLAESLFADCDSLENILLPDTLTYIKSNVFSGCAALRDISIPSSVTNIGTNAFTGSGIWNLPLNANIVYADNWVVGYRGPGGGGGSALNIREGTVGIAEDAFAGVTNALTAVIPGSVKYVGSGSFIDCVDVSINWTYNPEIVGKSYFRNMVKTVIFPEGTQTIAVNDFGYFRGVTTLEIPSTVTSVGSYAFNGWTSNQTIIIQGHTTLASADAAWGSNWRAFSNANIKYRCIMSGHSRIWETTSDPTCTNSGVQTSLCARCGTSATRGITALGHTFDEWEVSLLPSCTSEGEEVSACARSGCEHTVSRPIAALWHDWVWVEIISPTETTDGVEQHACQNCATAGETRAAYATGTLGLSYTSIASGTAYEVSCGTAISDTVNIPAYFNRLPVTAVAANAFSGKSQISQIAIPSSVINIGTAAFAYSSLTKIILLRTSAQGITTFNTGVFTGCPLTIVSVPFCSISEYINAEDWSIYNGLLFEIDGIVFSLDENWEGYFNGQWEDSWDINEYALDILNPLRTMSLVLVCEIADALGNVEKTIEIEYTFTNFQVSGGGVVLLIHSGTYEDEDIYIEIMSVTRVDGTPWRVFFGTTFEVYGLGLQWLTVTHIGLL